MVDVLHFGEWRPGDGRDEGTSPVFRVYRDGEYHFPIRTRMPEWFIGLLVSQCEGDTDLARRRAEEAILRWTVRRVEEDLLVSAIDVQERTDKFQVIDTAEEDLAAIRALATSKACRYQVRPERDMYCSASSNNDETQVGTSGLSVLAPTSMPTCRECDLPAAEFICEHLVHPQVQGVVTFGGWSRVLGSALCEDGRDEIGEPARCRPDGNPCWSRTVRPIETEPPPLSAMALPEALDYLDAIWRLAVGRPLLRLITAKDVAGIFQPCTSRTDFEERVTDLADIISNLSVDDAELPPDGEELHGSLNRLEAVLHYRLDAERASRAAQAVQVLRRVATVRNGFGHSGAAKKLPSAFAELGLGYPPQSWSEAWDQIRWRTITAVGIIRDEVASNLI